MQVISMKGYSAHAYSIVLHTIYSKKSLMMIIRGEKNLYLLPVSILFFFIFYIIVNK